MTSRPFPADFFKRLRQKDPTLWKSGDKEHQKIIRHCLGWLDLPRSMAAGPIRSFAAEICAEKFTHAVVLGMGGSSLACEVFRNCFPQAPGHPRLEVLDTTHPDAVASLGSRIDLNSSLFIVSSKSGSTIEPNCFMNHFYSLILKARGKQAGKQFIAITDPGTSLEKLAHSLGFRKVFLNPSDVGGRFSVLSYFGLVPAALMGINIEQLLKRARRAQEETFSASGGQSMALKLGAVLGESAKQGQDKLTLMLSPALGSFGLWIEQLVAESTGKEGKGILPVFNEPPPHHYGADRFFVGLDSSPSRQPALAMKLKDVYDLGGQFFIWEAATAAAGFLLELNPFDQPDVQSAKDQTKLLLETLDKKGKLPRENADFRAGGLSAFADPQLMQNLKGVQWPLAKVLGAHLSRLAPGDYFALLAYVNPDENNHLLLEKILGLIRPLSAAALRLDYGPRYLHSTGQFYKGGGSRGLFLELVESPQDIEPIPGQPFSFSTLCRAQAQGDFTAMIKAGRRILRLELGPSKTGSLQALANALTQLDIINA